MRGEARDAEQHEQSAIAWARAVGSKPLLARALADRIRSRDDAAARSEAEEILTELGAKRWLAAIKGGETVTAG